MDFEDLPNELLMHIISYMNLDDAKNVSLTSKKMYSLALERLWSKPRYTPRQELTSRSSLSFLRYVSRFPVSELHTREFKCSWLETMELLPKLKLLHLDNFWTDLKVSPEESQLSFLRVPVVLYTQIFDYYEEKHVADQLLKIIGSINVKEMIIDHWDSRWSLEQLKILASMSVNVSELSLGGFEITEENVSDQYFSHHI